MNSMEAKSELLTRIDPLLPWVRGSSQRLTAFFSALFGTPLKLVFEESKPMFLDGNECQLGSDATARLGSWSLGATCSIQSKMIFLADPELSEDEISRLANSDWFVDSSLSESKQLQAIVKQTCPPGLEVEFRLISKDSSGWSIGESKLGLQTVLA